MSEFPREAFMARGVGGELAGPWFDSPLKWEGTESKRFYNEDSCIPLPTLPDEMEVPYTVAECDTHKVVAEIMGDGFTLSVYRCARCGGWDYDGMVGSHLAGFLKIPTSDVFYQLYEPSGNKIRKKG